MEEKNVELLALQAHFKELEAENVVKDTQRSTAHKERNEALAGVAVLEESAVKHKAHAEATDMMAHELGQDCKWLINHGTPLIAALLMTSDEVAKYMFDLAGAAYNNGQKDGFAEGKAFALEERSNHEFELFKTDCTTCFCNKRKDFDNLEFGVLKAIEKLSRNGVAMDMLRIVLGDKDADTGAATGGGAVQADKWIVEDQYQTDLYAVDWLCGLVTLLEQFVNYYALLVYVLTLLAMFFEHVLMV
ncbi:hypothetical protein Hdeb2414_s0001g00021551 [Helianthus debilis subsp. tardiflorus]